MPESRAKRPGNRRDAMLLEAKRLVALLEQPEFDCFTWHSAVHDTMFELDQAYYVYDYAEGSSMDEPLAAK